MPDYNQRKKAASKSKAARAVVADVLQSQLRTPNPPWEFRLPAADAGTLSAWHGSLSPAGKARLEAAMKFLRVQPKDRWNRPQASSLGHSAYVIRFHDAAGSQHRVFGFFPAGHNVFVICLAGYEKDDVYYPGNYEASIGRYKADIGLDVNERTVHCTWPVG